MIRLLNVFLVGVSALCLLAVSSRSVRAEVAQQNVLSYVRMGEADTEAKAGGPAAEKTVDSARKDGVLRRSGTPQYVAVADSAAVAAVDSKLAIAFNGKDSRYAAAGLEPRNDNFCMEAFVKAESEEGFQFMLSWGAGTHGYSLVRNNKGYQVLLGGVNLVGWSGDVPAGQWVHVALVRDQGKTRFYFNGEGRGDSDQKPNEIGRTAVFSIGSSGDGKEGFFKGQVDEVRIFRFAPGKFNTADLLVNQKAK